MINWLKLSWYRILRSFRQTSKYIRLVESNESPDKPISYGTLFVVMGDTLPKWLKFRCPCGCGEELALPLIRTHSPYWTIKKEADGSLSVYPSINVTRGCRAHFWIIHNKVNWAE